MGAAKGSSVYSSAPSILGSSPKHAIHTFIIYSQICAIFFFDCEKNEMKRLVGLWPIKLHEKKTKMKKRKRKANVPIQQLTL